MTKNPKIQLQLSSLDKTVESVSKAVVVLMWALTLYAFVKLPMIIPTHFNAAGEVDDHGSKATLFILPGVATCFYLLLTYINKFPEYFSYKTKLTEENAQQQYRRATRVLRLLKLMILLLFTSIVLLTYLVTMGVRHGLGSWFLPVMIGVLQIPTIAAAIQFLREKSK